MICFICSNTMLRLTAPLLLILAAALVSYGQATTSNCPKIEVIGPAGVTNPGMEMVFTARLDVKASVLEHIWTVEDGVIVKGQGTDVIVLTGEPGAVVKARVVIEGLPEKCEDSAEATGTFAIIPDCGLPLDEWGELSQEEISVRLDSVFISLVNYPEGKGLVSFHVDNNDTLDSDNKLLKYFIKHVRFRKFDISRIVFHLERAETTRTVIRIVPSDSVVECHQCVEIRGRDLK